MRCQEKTETEKGTHILFSVKAGDGGHVQHPGKMAVGSLDATVQRTHEVLAQDSRTETARKQA